MLYVFETFNNLNMINYDNESINICQICLKVQPNTKHVFTIWNNTITFQKMISFLIDEIFLQEEDLSTKICDECEKTLIISYKFKELCLKSVKNNRRLLEKNKSVVKINSLDAEESQTSAEWLEQDSTSSVTDEEKVVYIIDETKIENQKPIKSTDPLDLDGKNFRYCRQCDLKFSDHQTYQAHHRQTHRIGKLCPFCGKLVLRQAMDKHLASHSQKRNFLCTECGKTFTLR